jgi:hypothetical protein
VGAREQRPGFEPVLVPISEHSPTQGRLT